MEGDVDGWPGYGAGVEGSGADDDRAPDDYWDGRLTNEDFVDRPAADTPPEAAPPEAGPHDDAPRDPARPLYDGRPIRDPYDRGGGYRRVSEAACPCSTVLTTAPADSRSRSCSVPSGSASCMAR